MKMKSFTGVALLAAACSTQLAQASIITYDTTQTAIFGSGNPDDGWARFLDLSTKSSISLRGKDRVSGDTSNASGVYNIQDGLAQVAPPRGFAQFEFSLNSGINPLNTYDWYLRIDTDPTAGTSFLTVKALTFYSDNSYGTASTANGAGVEGLASTYAGSNTIAQNSQNDVFLGHNPVIGGIYDWDAFSTLAGAGSDGAHIIDAHTQIVVGDQRSVPDGGSTAMLLGFGTLGVAALRRRKTADTTL